MNNKTLPTLAATAALLIGAGVSHAALIDYEGFDYAQQTGLASTGNWTDSSWRTNFTGYGEISTGLSYSTLPVVGQAARNENNFNQSYRTFAPQAATGTYWISFLMQKDAVDSGSFGISLFDGGTERNFMGQASSSNFSVAGQGSFISAIPVTTTASFFVARYNMDTGVAHFWINPSLSEEPSVSSAANGPAGTDFAAFSFDRIRLGKFDSSSGYLDEIRIGTTAGDVGFSAIPEPSAYAAIAGCGMLGLAMLRRRRQR